MTLIFTPKGSDTKGESDVGFWGDGEIDIIDIIRQATPDMLIPPKKKPIALKHTKQIVPKKRHMQRKHD